MLLSIFWRLLYTGWGRFRFLYNSAERSRLFKRSDVCVGRCSIKPLFYNDWSPEQHF